ncbi:MAG TPA: anti-sigma regulatory factor, partial [Bdellovibrionota bacterium]|nr:anti-sigma regulatory factor [Bdellovibrionota bacterium]
VVRVRQAVRKGAAELKLSLVDQTKVVTAASEIARNTVIYGGGGQVTIELLNVGPKRGLRLTFKDEGPGIENVEQALQDGFTSGGGLGLGLGGARRLVNDFEIDSAPGRGTRIVLTKWS